VHAKDAAIAVVEMNGRLLHGWPIRTECPREPDRAQLCQSSSSQYSYLTKNHTPKHRSEYKENDKVIRRDASDTRHATSIDFVHKNSKTKSSKKASSKNKDKTKRSKHIEEKTKAVAAEIKPSGNNIKATFKYREIEKPTLTPKNAAEMKTVNTIVYNSNPPASEPVPLKPKIDGKEELYGSLVQVLKQVVQAPSPQACKNLSKEKSPLNNSEQLVSHLLKIVQSRK